MAHVFQVAVSYAREDSDYVSSVVSHLRDQKVNLFFDRSEEIDLWGKDLYAELASIYGNRSWCCVMFLSQWYANKVWTNYERRIIQERALRENSDFILPVKLDQTEVPGFPPGLAFVDASQMLPEAMARTIVEKVRRLELSVEPALKQEPPPEDEGDGSGRYRLVMIYEPFWFGGGAYAVLPGDVLHRLAKITSGYQELNTFDGRACALTFDIEPRIKLDWVKIDEVHVRVNSHRPLPPYRPAFPRPYEQAHIYYAEIESKPGIYRADYYVAKGKRDIGFVRLFRGKPETVIVRINARTPGIYNFNVELLCSTRNERTLIPLVKDEEFAFDL